MMLKFVGREEELRRLEAEYRLPRGSVVAISGRRRVGKTTLIQKFLEGKPSVYFEADRATFTVNLRALAEALLEFASEEQIPLKMPSSDLNSLRMLEGILVSVVEYFQQRGQKFVLVLDEFPRLLRQTKSEQETWPSFDSFLQRLLDTSLKDKHFLLILSGSSASLMTKILGKHSEPLYGRSVLDLYLRPLGLKELAQFFDLSLEDSASRKESFYIYSVFGGVPHYWHILWGAYAEHQNLRHALVRVLIQDQTLKNEPDLLFQDEVHSAEALKSVLYALARRPLKEKEIKRETGLSSVSTYISVLEKSGLIAPVPEFSGTKLKEKQFWWQIVDPFLLLWFRFHRNLFFGIFDPDLAVKKWKKFEKNLVVHQGQVFEVLWQQTFSTFASNLKVGKIHVHDREKNSYEIDLIGVDPGKRLCFMAEVKRKHWTKKYVQDNVLKKFELLTRYVFPKLHENFSFLILSLEPSKEAEKLLKKLNFKTQWFDLPVKKEALFNFLEQFENFADSA